MIKRCIQGILCMGLLLGLVSAGGCSIFNRQETSTFQSAGVSYQATGGIKIVEIDAEKQMVYRVVCPFCGRETELKKIAPPAIGQIWEQEFDCPSCVYKGTLKITAVSAGDAAPAAAPAATPTN
jgi:ribosomal protein L37AE/L43A